MMDTEVPSENPVLIPLTFETSKELQNNGNNEINQDTQKNFPCIICKEMFLNTESNLLLQHLSSIHSVYIEDHDNISLFSEYLSCWKQEFKNQDFKTILKLDPKINMYILGREVEIDKKIRTKLLNKNIQEIFDMQTYEWSNGHFVKNCFFCAKVVFTNQTDFFNHLNEFHHFMLGSQHDFVNLNGFLNIIEEKLKKLQCLYCERFFKDYPAFKEHIRKKHHKRIKTTNPSYHHFYFDKHPELDKLKKLDDGEESNEDEEEDEEEDDGCYEGDDDDGCLDPVPIEKRLLENKNKKECCDWLEEGNVESTCLYCVFSSLQYSIVLEHMKDEHKFDLVKVQESLNFYQCVKLINYLRRQVYHNTCPFCITKMSNNKDLQSHFISTNHTSLLPQLHLFDQFQYYFPTYEEDPMLSYIHHEQESHDNDEDDNVICVTTETDYRPLLHNSYLQSLSLEDY